MEPIDRSPKVPEDRSLKTDNPVDRQNKRISDVCEEILGETNSSNIERLQRDFTAFCRPKRTIPDDLQAKIKAAKAKLDSFATTPPPLSKPSEAAMRPKISKETDFQLRHLADIAGSINTTLTSKNAHVLKGDLDDVCYKLLGSADIPEATTKSAKAAYEKLVPILYRTSGLAKKSSETVDITQIIRKVPDLCAVIKANRTPGNIPSLKRDLDETVYSLFGSTEITPTLADRLREANKTLLSMVGK